MDVKQVFAPWPEKPMLCVAANQWQPHEYKAVLSYERARAEAAISRLKLAVKTFKPAADVLRSCEKWTHGHEMRVDMLRIATEYDEALAQIGDLEGK